MIKICTFTDFHCKPWRSSTCYRRISQECCCSFPHRRSCCRCPDSRASWEARLRLNPIFILFLKGNLLRKFTTNFESWFVLMKRAICKWCNDEMLLFLIQFLSINIAFRKVLRKPFIISRYIIPSLRYLQVAKGKWINFPRSLTEYTSFVDVD